MKIIKLVLFLISLAFLSNSIAQKGLVAHWSFDSIYDNHFDKYSEIKFDFF